jgi:hypothetical protein
MRDLQVHPFAKFAPEMTDEELNRLIVDVRLHGVIDPILLFEGMVLDGRNRLEAAKRNQLPDSMVRFETFEGTRREALDLVLSKNAFRRHMNASQLAMMAARVHEAIHNDAEFTASSNWDAMLHSLREMISRKHRLGNVVWPPKEGFPATAPETLKEYARKKGIKNVAMYPIPDDGSFDNAAAIKEADDLGFTNLLPTDTPDPSKQTIDWENTDTRAEVDSMVKNTDLTTIDGFLRRGVAKTPESIGEKRGRPKGAVTLLADAHGVSRRSVERAINVVRNGSAELKSAVDQGRMSVDEAAERVSKNSSKNSSKSDDEPTRDRRERRWTPSRIARLITDLVDISDTNTCFVKSLSVSDAQKMLHLMTSAAARIGNVLQNNHGAVKSE